MARTGALLIGINLALLGALGLGAATATSRIGALERRLALREQTLQACQLTMHAIGQTRAVTAEALEPHLAAHRLGAPVDYGEGAEEWVIQPQGPPPDLTDFPELGLAFQGGVLIGAHAYKP